MPDEGGAGMTDQEQTERGASTADLVSTKVTAYLDAMRHYHKENPNLPGRCQVGPSEKWPCTAGSLFIEFDRLRADLERVTAELAIQRTEVQKASMVITDLIAEKQEVEAEREGWRNGYQEKVRELTQEVLRAARAEAERDAMREVAEAADGMRDCQMVVGSQCDHMRRLNGALARLDATRKATADATEEGK